MESKRSDTNPSFWRTPMGWVFIGFAGIAAYFLLTEHTAHVIWFLPWLFLLPCSLMHVFMHHGHGHDGKDHDHGADHQDNGAPKDQGPRDVNPGQQAR